MPLKYGSYIHKHALYTLTYLLVAAAGGLCAAALVVTLQSAFMIRTGNEWIVWLLPGIGFVFGLLIDRFDLERYSMSSLIDEVEGCDVTPLPARMGLWAFFGTSVAHLFGASVGREGAAIQGSAVLAGAWADRLIPSSLFPLSVNDDEKRLFRQEVLITGIAAGFAGAFRAPLGAAFFAIEMIRPGRLRVRSIGPALVGGIVGNWVASLAGVPKDYAVTLPNMDISLMLLGKWLVFAVAVALVVIGFIELTKFVARVCKRMIPSRPLRMAAGGALLVVLWQLVDTSIYLGLGAPVISQALDGVDVPTWAFLIKLVFTAIAIGTGFPGGEVTPLFFMGSTLGATLAAPLGLPALIATRVGLGAAFAAASNSPIAVTFMAYDLFGIEIAPWVGLCSLVAYFIVGDRSIYKAQLTRLCKPGQNGSKK